MSNLTLLQWLKEKNLELYGQYMTEQKERKRIRARNYAKKVAAVYKEAKKE